MSVFASHHPRMSWSRVGVIAIVLTAAGVGLLLRGGGTQTANIAPLTTTEATPEATVFPQPKPVEWQGRIIRRLAGGQGLELQGTSAPGGYFFAYHEGGLLASVSEDFVTIRGQWTGISCEYGRCAPEVEARSIEAAPIELE